MTCLKDIVIRESKRTSNVFLIEASFSVNGNLDYAKITDIRKRIGEKIKRKYGNSKIVDYRLRHVVELRTDLKIGYIQGEVDF